MNSTANGIITKSFEFKIRQTREFVEAAERRLDRSRFVYNCALEERITLYRRGKSIGLVEQSRELTEARRELPALGEVLRTIQTDALERLDLAFQAFFKRLKKGQSPGFPRFKSKARYRTFSQKLEPCRRCPLDGDRLTIPGVGRVRVRLSRPIAGKVKQLRITRKADGWYAILICDCPEPDPLPKTRAAQAIVGIDVGLEYFATLSMGETIPNPRHLRRRAKALKRSQQALARKQKKSANRGKSRKRVALGHLRVVRARKDFHHKTALDLVRRFDHIVVEDLKIRNMIRNRALARSIADAAWGSFLDILETKAAWAGRTVERVDPRWTSQTCSGCGHRQRMGLAERVFVCGQCGVVIDRDHNAAVNIASSGREWKPLAAAEVSPVKRNVYRKSGAVTTTDPILPSARH